MSNCFKHLTPGTALLVSLCMAATDVARAQATSVLVRGSAHRYVGGVTELDRARYFGYHGTLTPGAFANDLLIAEDGLRANTSRSLSELASLAKGLPEDPTRPGFIDPTALVNEINNQFNPFINNSGSSSRWRPIIEAENPIFIQSGRPSGDWPEYLRTIPAGLPNAGTVHPNTVQNFPAYVEMLQTFFTHLDLPDSFGEGRYLLEIMNEPNAPKVIDETWDIQRAIDFHTQVIPDVKALFPNQKIGGPSFCCADYGDDDMGQWFGEMKPFIDQAGSMVDFISYHPYDRYTVQADGSVVRDFSKGPGHMAASMDLIEAYSDSTLGEVKPFAFTEYGSWNQTQMADGSYGSYSREQQQWDLSKNIREKLFVFMDRPDRIEAATMFFAARNWMPDVPTAPSADNVLWEQDETGAWHETILAKMMRMYAPVEGHYIPVETFDSDLQIQGFRDGDQIHLMLNNLRTTDHEVSLFSLLNGSAAVTAAQIDRIQYVNGALSHVDDLDVTDSWQTLTLTPEESAVLTLTVHGPQIYDQALSTDTYYGNTTAEALDSNGSSSTFQIEADLEDAQSVTARVSFVRPNGVDGEALQVFINGHGLLIPSGELAVDDNDYTSLISREIEVPLSILVDGINDVQVDFVDTGGRMVATVLEVTRTIGEYNGDLSFGPEDIDALFAAFGATEVDGRFDLAGSDGVVDEQDVAHWLSVLRGTEFGDANLDGEVSLLDLDILGANWQAEGTGWAGGDFNGDGIVSLLDLDILGVNWGFGAATDLSTFSAALAITGVPAPAVTLPVLVWIPFLRRRRSS